MLRLGEIDGGTLDVAARERILAMNPQGFKIRQRLDLGTFKFLDELYPNALWIVRPQSNGGVFPGEVIDTVRWLQAGLISTDRIIATCDNEPNHPDKHWNMTGYAQLVQGALNQIKRETGVRTCTPAAAVNPPFNPMALYHMMMSVDADFVGVHDYWQGSNWQSADWGLIHRRVQSLMPGRPIILLEVNEDHFDWNQYRLDRLHQQIVASASDGVWGWCIFALATSSGEWQRFWPPTWVGQQISDWPGWNTPPTGGSKVNWGDVWNQYSQKRDAYPALSKGAAGSLGFEIQLGPEYDLNVNGEDWRFQDYLTGLVGARVGQWHKVYTFKSPEDVHRPK